MARKKYNYFSNEMKDNQKLDDFFEDKILEAKPKVEEKKIKVAVPLLNVRGGPGYNNAVVEQVTDGKIYDLLEEKEGWGRIADNKWVMLQYTVKI